jgi:hypothetical protein
MLFKAKCMRCELDEVVDEDEVRCPVCGAMLIGETGGVEGENTRTYGDVADSQILVAELKEAVRPKRWGCAGGRFLKRRHSGSGNN